MNYSLQQLRHLIAVADAGSLGKAARLVHVSQPALTKSMHKLEEGVGLQLFDRGGPMKLSAVGRAFLVRARRLVDESAELSREVSRLGRAVSGEVVVGCGPLMPETFVAPAVAEMISQNRGLAVTVEIGNWLEFVTMLRSGRLDFFVANVSMLRDEPDLEIEAFPAEPAVWCARPGHPLAGRRRIPAAEFFAYPFVGPALPAWVDNWLQQQSGATPDAPFRLAATCSHYPSLKVILSGGDCVSGAIESILSRDFADGTLVRLDVDLPPLTMQAGLVWMRHRTLSPAATALVDGIKRHVAGLARAHSEVRASRHSRAPSRKIGTSRKK